MNDSQREILEKIKQAVKNPTTMHVLDERRVACIFYNLVKQKSKELEEISLKLDEVPGWSKEVKERVEEIAYVIELLAHCN